MNLLPSHSGQPLLGLLLGSAFVACAPGASNLGEDEPVLVTPASSDVAPADIGLPLPQPELTFQPSVITVGKYHACTLLLDGRLACWGSNAYGKLGIGTTAGSYKKPQRSQSALTGMTTVSAGESHTCVARGSNGLVSCWGRNAYGAVNPRQPNGSPPAEGCALELGCSTPSTISNVSNVELIAAGYDHTCVFGGGGVTDPDAPTDKGVICWGRSDTNLLLQDGGGWPVNKWEHGVKALDAGERFTCKQVDFAGTRRVHCWGAWFNGLGIFTPTDNVFLGHDLASVTVGERHMCTLGSIVGDVNCQGESLSGQTGRITSPSAPYVNQPNRVLEGATMVAAGTRHTCAITNNGRVKCWGANDKGQLGVGETFATSSTALTALLPADQVARSIAAGGGTTCVRTESRRLYCWGDNGYGQVGVDSSDDMIATPSRVGW